MVDSDSTRSAIERFVRTFYTQKIGFPRALYVLKAGITPEQRRAVLVELRQLYPGAAIEVIGEEIAIWWHVEGQR